MRAFLAGARVQLRFIVAYPDMLIPFITAPLFTIVFMLVFKHAGRQDLNAYAAIAPVFIALWWLALFNSGWTITTERWNGTLELSFFESWLVARVIFGATVTIYHWGAFVLTVFATLAAMAGTAVGMAALFVLARNAVTFSNSASYPFYVLGGILVPVSLLPHWVRPLSAVVFLSWSAGLLRATLKAAPIHEFWPHLGMVVLLGACGFAVGLVALRVILVRVRQSGELSTT